MGKNDFLTPKAIANRIKSKGLQKLRWYCQLCQKQCRDENGFKCHTTSESHKRQMMVFGQNPERVLEGFSEEFEAAFLEHLRRTHPKSRVAANIVYNEYIADKEHVHMNATKWNTLTEFVKYLGKEGKCKVEDTPKGWFITIVTKDAEKALEAERRAKRERKEAEDEYQSQRQIEAQIERARKTARVGGMDAATSTATELQRGADDGPLAFSFDKDAQAKAAKERETSRFAPKNVFGALKDGTSGPSSRRLPSKKTNKLEELIKKGIVSKQGPAEAGPDVKAGDGKNGGGQGTGWLAKGIVVKILSKALKSEGLYKQKGVVVDVIDSFVGEVEALTTGTVVRVDQQDLETVLPKEGGQVLILRGQDRGTKAELRKIDEAKFKAQVVLLTGPGKGDRVWLEYEDVSKLSK